LACVERSLSSACGRPWLTFHTCPAHIFMYNCLQVQLHRFVMTDRCGLPCDDCCFFILAVVYNAAVLCVQAGAECDVGKADAAWLEGAPDTANSCDSSCGSTPQEAA
jgi:hypothetical protein